MRTAVVPCALGFVAVAATERGVCAIDLGEDPQTLRAAIRQRFKHASIDDESEGFELLVRTVVSLIADPGRLVDLPLDIQGTAFQRRVWEELQRIPAGRTASYAEIAERIGKPSAARAVGSACASNKIAVAIPCHRVLRSDGELNQYRWGIERKRELLRRESPDEKP